MEIQSLTLLANMLANKYNVDVRAEGCTANCSYDQRTNKTTITVPAFVIDNDAQRIYVRGFIDHEIGHARFTDWSKITQASASTAALHSITNILEDVYIERMMSQCYPGCALNLKAMQHQLFEVDKTFEKNGVLYDEDKQKNADAYWLILRYILYSVRNVQSLVSTAKDDLDSTFPGLSGVLDPLLNRVPVCNNSGDNTELGREIYAAIKRYLDSPNENQNQGKSDSDQGQPEEQDDNGQGQGQGDGQDSSDNQSSNGDGQDNNGDGQDSSDNQSSNGTGAGSSSADSLFCKKLLIEIANNADFTWDSNKKIGGAVENAIQKGIDELVRDSDMHGSLSGATMHDCDDTGILARIPDTLRDEAMGCACALSAQLQALMQAKGLRKRRAGLNGKLDNNKLHRIALNNPRVFLRSTEVKQVNTQVLLLCDASGSMREDCKDKLTTKAVYALLKALRNIPGVRSGAYTFGGYFFEAMSEFDTPLYRSKMYLKDCSGGTPGGSALQRALHKLDLMKDDRKIVIVLTDGDFDHGERDVFRAVYKSTQDAGIDVIGVGIRSNAVAKLWKKGDFFYIEDLKELAPKLFEILRERLV